MIECIIKWSFYFISLAHLVLRRMTRPKHHETKYMEIILYTILPLMLHELCFYGYIQVRYS